MQKGLPFHLFENQLNVLLKVQESCRKRKSREHHIKLRDANTRYICHKTHRKYKASSIDIIANESGISIVGSRNIAQYFVISGERF